MPVVEKPIRHDLEQKTSFGLQHQLRVAALGNEDSVDKCLRDAGGFARISSAASGGMQQPNLTQSSERAASAHDPRCVLPGCRLLTRP